VVLRLCAALLLLVLLIPAGWGEENEAEVKAALLYNFAKYVEWPDSGRTRGPLVFGIVNSDGVAESLQRISVGRTVAGREVRVVVVDPAEVHKEVDVLFIGGNDDRGEVPRAIGLLSVGESPRFLERGGAITFVRREAKVRFDINVEAATRAELRISSALIGLADRIVRR